MGKENHKHKMPFYCVQCNKCSTDNEAINNLKVKNNTGYTHNIYCEKRKTVVYGL